MLRIAILFLALAAAGGAAWMISTRTGAPEQPVVVVEAAPDPTSEILVAAEDIGLGDRVTAAQFRWQSWPDHLRHDGFIVRDSAADAAARLDGAIARSRMVAGEPILPGKLAEPGSGLLAALLMEGERALAVRITAENTAGGLVVPGDRVDVLLVRNQRNARGEDATMAETILRNIEVLAIDQQAGDPEPGAFVGRTATLRLTAEQAERLAAAEASGRIALALRAAHDRLLVEPDGVAPPEPEVVTAAVEAGEEEVDGTVIRVRRGAETTDVRLPLSPRPKRPTRPNPPAAGSRRVTRPPTCRPWCCRMSPSTAFPPTPPAQARSSDSPPTAASPAPRWRSCPAASTSP